MWLFDFRASGRKTCAKDRPNQPSLRVSRRARSSEPSPSRHQRPLVPALSNYPMIGQFENGKIPQLNVWKSHISTPLRDRSCPQTLVVHQLWLPTIVAYRRTRRANTPNGLGSGRSRISSRDTSLSTCDRSKPSASSSSLSALRANVPRLGAKLSSVIGQDPRRQTGQRFVTPFDHRV